MVRTGVVIDSRYRDHDTGVGHPERPARIEVLLASLEECAGNYIFVPAREASGDEISLAHDPGYIAEVAATAERHRFAFDPDTPTSPRSYDTARLAVGGFLSLLDQICTGGIDNGFAFVRPPGHHAEYDRAMGFCLFNNIAVGAQYLRRRYGVERVLIMDWDVHHGNGTQHIFEADPGVLYASIHQSPFYPGTGAIEESGAGDGEGFTVNIPLPPGCGDAEYADVFRRVIEPISRAYEPDFILISAGFDAHHRDPLASMRVTENGFRVMARSLLDLAGEHSGGRCAAILEGGYDLKAICDSALAVLDEFRGSSSCAEPISAASRADVLIERFVRHQQRFWRI